MEAIGYGTLGLCGLCCCYGHIQARRVLAPMPSAEELAKLGGEVFKRPSDGLRLEYFRRGHPTGVNGTIILIHGGVGDGTNFADWDPASNKAAADAGVTVIYPTMPGFGTTDPLSAPRKARVWLDAISSDLLALVGDTPALGVAGISAFTEVAFATAILARQRGMKLMGVAAISGAPWATKNYTAVDAMTCSQRFATCVFTSSLTEACCAYCCLRPMIKATSGEAMAQQEPSFKKALDEHPEYATLIGQSMNRCTTWHTWGVYGPTSMMMSQSEDVKADYKSLSGTDVKVLVIHGSEDKMAPQAAPKFILDQITQAEDIVLEGRGHTEVGVTEAISGFLSALM